MQILFPINHSLRLRSSDRADQSIRPIGRVLGLIVSRPIPAARLSASLEFITLGLLDHPDPRLGPYLHSVASKSRSSSSTGLSAYLIGPYVPALYCPRPQAAAGLSSGRFSVNRPIKHSRPSMVCNCSAFNVSRVRNMTGHNCHSASGSSAPLSFPGPNHGSVLSFDRPYLSSSK